MNILDDVVNEEIQEYMRVFIRGKCVKFSPKVINAYLGRNKFAPSDDILSLDQIAIEITGGQVKE